MATKKKKLNVRGKDGCITFKVKRKYSGGPRLARSKEVTRCEGRKFKVGKRCHAGGPNWKKQIPKHTKSFAKLAPATFVKCHE